MKLVIQRVKHANVKVENKVIGKIGQGLMILVGISENDSDKDVKAMVNKVPHLRVFEDEVGKMNLSLHDVKGGILSISQFTLYADTRKGRRPSFVHAAKPEKAETLYQYFNNLLRSEDIQVAEGQFGAMMDIDLVNEGPVTIILETKDGKII